MKKAVLWYSIIFLILGLSSPALSQEILCNVNIDDDGASTTNKQLIQELTQRMQSFINDRVWTQHKYESNERIKMNILFTLDKNSTATTFTGVAQIQTFRPVYNTDYETTVLNFIDQDFSFEYAAGQQVDYNENIFTSDLSSLLMFYSFIALFYDYDSFKQNGGSEYLEKARVIANYSADRRGGWSQDVSGNNPNTRYNFIDKLNNAVHVPFREVNYTYHRICLDEFLIDMPKARNKAIETLAKLKSIYAATPNSVVLKTFFQTKRQEIIDMFNKADAQTKERVINVLKEIDPLNIEKYTEGINKT